MVEDKNISIGIVTSGIHLRRAEKTFQSYFSNITPVPAGLFCQGYKWRITQLVPEAKNIGRVKYIIIEYVGYVWYILSGRIRPLL